MTKELWRTIEGFESYQVSNLGRIKSLNYGKEKILKQGNTNGYKSIHLYKNGKRYKFRVHRLVAMAFCEGYQEGLEVDHINFDRCDNRAENLRWVTGKENSEHSASQSRDACKVVCVETGIIYDTYISAGRAIGRWWSGIKNCCEGTQKTCGGYHWKKYNKGE